MVECLVSCHIVIELHMLSAVGIKHGRGMAPAPNENKGKKVQVNLNARLCQGIGSQRMGDL